VVAFKDVVGPADKRSFDDDGRYVATSTAAATKTAETAKAT
jgi:hypothetical protein